MDKVILILKLLPTIIAIMRAIEEAIPGQGAGEAKLAAVREILELGESKVNEFWPEVSKVIGILVTTFNKVGWAKA